MTVHRRLEFDMPAASAVVFDAFHYHHWRPRWDSLVRDTIVQGGAPCPSVGAVSTNGGGGWLRSLSMRTKFVAFERPRLAAATMQGRAFPFARWAASMRHEAMDSDRSRMIYTYTFDASFRWLEPVVALVFERQTRRRFARLQDFLAAHSGEVRRWQDDRHAD